MRKAVYIAGPISKGDLCRNIDQADAAFVQLALLGFAPMNPILTVYLGGATRREAAAEGVIAAAKRSSSTELQYTDFMEIDFEWVRRADALLRLPGESLGADAEAEVARAAGVPVFTTIMALKDHFEVKSPSGRRSVPKLPPALDSSKQLLTIPGAKKPAAKPKAKAKAKRPTKPRSR